LRDAGGCKGQDKFFVVTEFSTLANKENNFFHDSSCHILVQSTFHILKMYFAKCTLSSYFEKPIFLLRELTWNSFRSKEIEMALFKKL